MRKILAAVIGCAGACASMTAHAQSAGDNVVGLGWFHVMPQDSSSELTTHVAPVPINTPLRLPSQFTSAGTSLSTKSADTFGLVFTHFFTDHIATTFVGGVPPEFELDFLDPFFRFEDRGGSSSSSSSERPRRD